MAFTVHRPGKSIDSAEPGRLPAPSPAETPTMQDHSPRRLLLAADGVTIVEEGDRRGTSLLVGKGCKPEERDEERVAAYLAEYPDGPVVEPPRPRLAGFEPEADADGDGTTEPPSGEAGKKKGGKKKADAKMTPEQ